MYGCEDTGFYTICSVLKRVGGGALLAAAAAHRGEKLSETDELALMRSECSEGAD